MHNFSDCQDPNCDVHLFIERLVNNIKSKRLMDEKKDFFMGYYLRNEGICFSLLEFYVDRGFFVDLMDTFYQLFFYQVKKAIKMSGSSLLDKIKIFASDDALLNKFMKFIKKFEKLSSAQTTATSANVLLVFKGLFIFFFFLKKKTFRLMKRKKFLWDSALVIRMCSIYCKRIYPKNRGKMFFFMI